MSNDQEQNANGDSNDPNIQTLPVCEEVSKPQTDTTDSPKQTTSPPEINKEPINVIVNIPQEENRPERTANLIGWISLCVNGILAFFTYMLFLKTVEANQTSQNALSEAKRANDISTQALAEARGRDMTSDRKDSITIGIAQQSLKTQINSFERSQRQFEIDNMPYLQCTNFSFTQIEPNKVPIIRFQIFNLGRQAAKVLTGKYGYAGIPVIFDSPLKELPWLANDSIVNGTYINNTSPFSQYFVGNTPIPEYSMNQIKKGALAFTFFGEITYINEVTKKQRMYIFNVRMYPDSPTEFTVIKNENIDKK